VTGAPLEIRPMRGDDRPGVLTLLGTSLGWRSDARHQDLFAWKHERGTFGPSPAWVALDGDRVIGLRVLLRWDFEQCGRTIHAVRPVDTATDPGYRGRGVFTRLTLHALDDARVQGAELVFNTPNDQSRAGYLKMGWRVIGKLRAVARPTHFRRTSRMLRAHSPADRWAIESHTGLPATEVLGDRAALEGLIGRRMTTVGLRTQLTPEFLAWRYGEPFLGYRAIVGAEGVAGGVAIFRVRRRGCAREAALCEVLVPSEDPHATRRLVRELRSSVDADYVLAIRTAAWGDHGLWPMLGRGPVLTARTLTDASPPDRDEWALTLGDVELF
jgi:GNAT superfamily N-acetyltransferase